MATPVLLSASAVARTPSLASFYKYRQPPTLPGDYTFHLDLLRPGLPPLSIDRTVQSLSWVDQAAQLTGTVTAYYPDPADPTSLPVARGHLVRCRVAWGSSTYELWTMRVGAAQAEIDTGVATIPLTDDMALLDAGKRDWHFRETKRRPYGYTADEIAAVVANELGVKIRTLAKGTLRQHFTLRAGTGAAVIQKAYLAETIKTGRRFVMRMRNGQLEVIPLQRNPTLYTLNDQIQTALITQASGSKVPTTVLTGRGHIGNGKGARTVSHTEYDRGVIAMFGKVADTKNYGRVESLTDLIERVRRDLASRLRINSTIEITHAGIPFILRGDAVEVDLPQWGYGGAQAFVFCQSASHNVSAGSYTTDWVFNASDPYVTRKVTTVAKARQTKATARRRAKIQASSRKAHR